MESQRNAKIPCNGAMALKSSSHPVELQDNAESLHNIQCLFNRSFFCMSKLLGIRAATVLIAKLFFSVDAQPLLSKSDTDTELIFPRRESPWKIKDFESFGPQPAHNFWWKDLCRTILAQPHNPFVQQNTIFFFRRIGSGPPFDLGHSCLEPEQTSQGVRAVFVLTKEERMPWCSRFCLLPKRCPVCSLRSHSGSTLPYVSRTDAPNVADV